MNCSNDPNRSYWSRLEATWKEKYLPSFRTSDILYELLQTTFKQPSRLSDLQNTDIDCLNKLLKESSTLTL